jgi:CheY-like chemotaxis protein
MNGVLGMLQALRQTDLSPQQKQMCDVLDRSGQMLIRVLNDILDYSKLEAGKIVLEMVPVNVMELVDDVSSLIIPSAEAKGLQIKVTHRDQPPLLLLDPTRLRQILSNLLSNAVKFSRHGKIYVELAAAVDAANLDHTNVIIRVRDTGIGMSADTVQRLFTRFTQADASATRKFGGTGLGLAISRELATLMNGDISVTSALGLGSEFVVHLRAQHAPQGALEVAGDDAPCLLRAGHALRILVAEDMEVNRIVLASLFSATGHQLSFAHDGRAAVAMVQQAEYDVVLMDIMMPEMDGLDATRAIRALGGAYEIIPIIALTADVLSEERERYTRLGMNACVAKPIVRAELFGTLNRIMGFDCQARTDDTAGAPVTEDAVEDDLLNAIDGLFGHAAPAA